MLPAPAQEPTLFADPNAPLRDKHLTPDVRVPWVRPAPQPPSNACAFEDPWSCVRRLESATGPMTTRRAEEIFYGCRREAGCGAYTPPTYDVVPNAVESSVYTDLAPVHAK